MTQKDAIRQRVAELIRQMPTDTAGRIEIVCMLMSEFSIDSNSALMYWRHARVKHETIATAKTSPSVVEKWAYLHASRPTVGAKKGNPIITYEQGGAKKRVPKQHRPAQGGAIHAPGQTTSD